MPLLMAGLPPWRAAVLRADPLCYQLLMRMYQYKALVAASAQWSVAKYGARLPGPKLAR